VVKQYHIAGNTVINSCLKIRNNDDRDFPPKMTFIRTLKIFREFGLCSKSLGTNWTPRQKRVQLERLGGWSPTYMSKEPYVYTPKIERVKARVHACERDKVKTNTSERAQERESRRGRKKPYVYVKRALYTCQKSPYIHVKRALYTCQKSHMYYESRRRRWGVMGWLRLVGSLR